MLLNCDDWLREHGFDVDPFDFDSWNADTDLKIIENFVHPKNYSSVVGELKRPGHCFIFAPSGGGKTHLRRYIKAQFDSLLFIPGIHDKVLALEYDIGQYSENASTAEHIQRLISNINVVLANHGDKRITYSNSISPENMLGNIARICREVGYDGVYVLVDNIISQSENTIPPDAIFLRISDLIKDFSLFSVRNKGIVFKFFLPLELYETIINLYGNKIPEPPVILWDRTELQEIFHRKLVGSLSREIRSDRSFEIFTELFEWSLRKNIIDEIVGFGVQAGYPRAMLLLSSRILNEHFNGFLGRRGDDLITQNELVTALEKSENEILIRPTATSENFVRDEIEYNSNYDLFISHAWEDNEFSDKLVEALREKGLRVWYDKSEILVGDKIVPAIENGLKAAKYVVVVLSPSYFMKKWTEEELLAALNLETPIQKKVLPIWHDITVEQIKNFSPILSSRLALRSDIGIEELVRELLQAIRGKDKL